MYRGINKGVYVLLSRTPVEQGRAVKQEQEEVSRNHVQTFISPSVQYLEIKCETLKLYNLNNNNK